MPLTDTELKKAKPREKSYKLFDGGGLYIEITPNGSKGWRYKYRINGKEKRISLGVYPEVSLKDARFRHSEQRQLVSQGVDPSEKRKATKLARADGMGNTFEVISREWYAINQKSWNPSHGVRIIRRLELNIFPYLGNIPITEITNQKLIEVIKRIHSRGVLETAHRAVQNCAQVFKFAILTSRAEINVAENIKGFLPAVKEKHHAAIIEPKKVGSLLNAIDNASGTIATRCAIRLMPLVFVRSLELRRAEWKDIDFNRAEWSLHITKTDTPHIVPLSKQAIKILKEIQPITGSGQYIFASEISKSGYLSENTMLRLLREMGISKEEMSIHGFRAMARTILHERLNVDPVIIEHQLAHKVPDALGRAYNRTQFIEQRKKMMQTWANYLDKVKLNKDE